MAIYALLRDANVGNGEARRLIEAYETALKRLRLSDRSDPLTKLIAGKIMEVARRGEGDPAQLCTLALQELGIAQE